MKKKIIQKIIAVASVIAVSVTILSLPSYAKWNQIGYLGDLNGDQEVSITDGVIMQKHLVNIEPLSRNNGYEVDGKYIGINGGEGVMTDYVLTADLNQDGRVNCFDLCLLKENLISGNRSAVWQWEDDPVPEFIDPPIYDQYGSLPSQGDAKALVFYVDFPDCRYNYLPSVSEIEEVAFGEEDESDVNYPFESMSAFYKRSSKGAMNLSGDAYIYTTKQNKTFYENDAWHIELVNEIIEVFNDSIDFSQFDGDGDNVVDTILISVPEESGNKDWWSTGGGFGGDTHNRADGMDIGHVIVGNAEIKSETDYMNFNKTYLHEMGHCMGLPDYYLYGVDDFQGMHGSAGYELMDDSLGDFGAASKLMLGWYTNEQINVYDESLGSQTYTLNNGQAGEGNCVIIPCSELADKYRSEFFIIEYTTLDGNNTYLNDFWWRKTGSGIRVYHVEATNNGNPSYYYWKYASGEDEATKNNNGRRFIRLINEGTDDTDNLFYTGNVIDSSISGFKWYDSDDNLTIDPGLRITIGAGNNDTYDITIENK